MTIQEQILAEVQEIVERESDAFGERKQQILDHTIRIAEIGRRAMLLKMDGKDISPILPGLRSASQSLLSAATVTVGTRIQNAAMGVVRKLSLAALDGITRELAEHV